jgi:ferredoxin-NADP reductase
MTASPAPSGGWRRAVVRDVGRDGPRFAVVRLEVEDRVLHLPGQHYVIRLRAEDGYTASRSYSIASAPSDDLVEICVKRLPQGEVSEYLADIVRSGDELEVRGPLGGWFVWDGSAPALAVGGGSGVVPLVSMLRHARDAGVRDRICLVAAASTRDDLPYVDEILGGCNVVALSREASPDGRPAGRLTAEDFAAHQIAAETVYVCGSASFAEATTRLLVDIGVDPATVRVERFGPSA